MICGNAQGKAAQPRVVRFIKELINVGEKKLVDS